MPPKARELESYISLLCSMRSGVLKIINLSFEPLIKQVKHASARADEK
jgi:hypothetical protein